MTSEDKYEEERENLIEGDPIVLVDELLRLRRIEAALLDGIAWKATQVAATRMRAQLLYRDCEIEQSLAKQQEARNIDAERFELEQILAGKNIA